MKEIVGRLDDEDMRPYRDNEVDLTVLQSGSVAMSMKEARAIVVRHRAFWTYMMDKYHLDDDEFYVVDAVTGTISVDKAE